jgi:hypothetical protein
MPIAKGMFNANLSRNTKLEERSADPESAGALRRRRGLDRNVVQA